MFIVELVLLENLLHFSENPMIIFGKSGHFVVLLFFFKESSQDIVWLVIDIFFFELVFACARRVIWVGIKSHSGWFIEGGNIHKLIKLVFGLGSETGIEIYGIIDRDFWVERLHSFWVAQKNFGCMLSRHLWVVVCSSSLVIFVLGCGMIIIYLIVVWLWSIFNIIFDFFQLLLFMVGFGLASDWGVEGWGFVFFGFFRSIELGSGVWGVHETSVSGGSFDVFHFAEEILDEIGFL